MTRIKFYVRALGGCFHSHFSIRTFRRAPTRAGGQLRGDKECRFSGVTKSGIVWRKVPESDARSVWSRVNSHSEHRFPAPCRKPVLGVLGTYKTVEAA